jgi:hypothetical protein
MANHRSKTSLATTRIFSIALTIFRDIVNSIVY